MRTLTALRSGYLCAKAVLKRLSSLSPNQEDSHSVIVINRPFRQPGFLKREGNVGPSAFLLG